MKNPIWFPRWVILRTLCFQNPANVKNGFLVPPAYRQTRADSGPWENNRKENIGGFFAPRIRRRPRQQIPFQSNFQGAWAKKLGAGGLVHHSPLPCPVGPMDNGEKKINLFSDSPGLGGWMVAPPPRNDLIPDGTIGPLDMGCGVCPPPRFFKKGFFCIGHQWNRWTTVVFSPPFPGRPLDFLGVAHF